MNRLDAYFSGSSGLKTSVATPRTSPADLGGGRPPPVTCTSAHDYHSFDKMLPRATRPLRLARQQQVSMTRHHAPRMITRRNHTSAGKAPPGDVPSSSRVQRYLPRLQDLSRRTGVPLSSLAISFLVLHELTAVLPVIGFYFLFSSLGTGLGIINWLDRTTGTESEEPAAGWRSVVKGWYDEAQGKIARVGKRYNLWQAGEEESAMMPTKGRAGEGVANAISAYVVVKVRQRSDTSLIPFTDVQALLPVRIGVSLGAAPMFARWALEPIRSFGKRLVRARRS